MAGADKAYIQITDPWLGESASGPEKMSAEELAANCSDPIQDILTRPLDSHWYRERSVDWSKVTVPFLSAANWAGFGVCDSQHDSLDDSKLTGRSSTLVGTSMHSLTQPPSRNGWNATLEGTRNGSTSTTPWQCRDASWTTF